MSGRSLSRGYEVLVRGASCGCVALHPIGSRQAKMRERSHRPGPHNPRVFDWCNLPVRTTCRMSNFAKKPSEVHRKVTSGALRSLERYEKLSGNFSNCSRPS